MLISFEATGKIERARGYSLRPHVTGMEVPVHRKIITPETGCPHPHEYNCLRCDSCARAHRRIRPTDRFWPKVDKNGPIPAHRPDLGSCWLWTGYLNIYGYGQFYLAPAKYVQAHRWPYEQKHGSIPKGLEPDHLCHTPACVRDDHLELVTHQVNVARGAARQNGALQRAKTHCPQTHPYH